MGMAGKDQIETWEVSFEKDLGRMTQQDREGCPLHPFEGLREPVMSGVGVVHADQRQRIHSATDPPALVHQQGHVGIGEESSHGLTALGQPVCMLMVAQDRPHPKRRPQGPKIFEKLLHGSAIAPGLQRISSDQDKPRSGFGQHGKHPAFTKSVPHDMQIREMGDDQSVKGRWNGLEPRLVAGDFDPIWLDQEGITKEQQQETDKNGDATTRAPVPPGHERSNRPSCSSSARVKGIG